MIMTTRGPAVSSNTAVQFIGVPGEKLTRKRYQNFDGETRAAGNTRSRKRGLLWPTPHYTSTECVRSLKASPQVGSRNLLQLLPTGQGGAAHRAASNSPHLPNQKILPVQRIKK